MNEKLIEILEELRADSEANFYDRGGPSEEAAHAALMREVDQLIAALRSGDVQVVPMEAAT